MRMGTGCLAGALAFALVWPASTCSAAPLASTLGPQVPIAEPEGGFIGTMRRTGRSGYAARARRGANAVAPASVTALIRLRREIGMIAVPCIRPAAKLER